MSVVTVVELESLREEVAELRAALADRDETLGEKDDAIAVRDLALAELTKKLRLTSEELDYLKRRLFGRKSEKFSGPTLFDDLVVDEPAPAENAAPDDEGSTLTEREKKKAAKRPRGRRPLPPHLARKRFMHELADDERSCGTCGKEMVRIGEESSETLQFIPAHLEVHVHVRGKYACRCGEAGVVTPPVPPRPIAGSYVGAGLLAHVLVSKYKDHLPLYRQAGMLRRLDLDVARSTLCDWVAGGARLLGPVAGAIRRSVLAQDPIQADETPVQVQQGPKGRPKEAYFFAYRGCESGEVFYDFRMGRGSEGPAEVLADFHGTLQIDGYQGYDRIVRDNGLVAAGCLDHARRKFFDAIESAPNEAALVLVAMRRLYKIEERAVGMTAEDRGRLRARESRPRLDQLHELIETLARDTLPSSRLGKARYGGRDTENGRYGER